MFSDQRNLILAIVVSLSILLAFEFFYNSPRLQKEAARQQAIEQSLPQTGSETGTPSAGHALSVRPQSSSAPGIRPQVSTGCVGIPCAITDGGMRRSGHEFL